MSTAACPPLLCCMHATKQDLPADESLRDSHRTSACRAHIITDKTSGKYPVFLAVTKACFSPLTSNMTVSPSTTSMTGPPSCVRPVQSDSRSCCRHVKSSQYCRLACRHAATAIAASLCASRPGNCLGLLGSRSTGMYVRYSVMLRELDAM